MFMKPLGELTFEDVVEYCKERHREGLTLDYKWDQSKSIAKVACAFANTFGGVIVVGVREVNELPLEPFDGVENTQELKRSIRDTILEYTYPPIMPVIYECTNEQSHRGFILVDVRRSELAPHAYDNREIYRRYLDRNNPTNHKTGFADLDWIESLMKRRRDWEKYIEMRESAFDRLHRQVHRFHADGIVVPDGPAVCSIMICPLWPPDDRVGLSSLIASVNQHKMETQNYMEDFLFNSNVTFKTLQDGIYGSYFLDEPGSPDAYQLFILFGDDGFIGVRSSVYKQSIARNSGKPIENVCRLNGVLEMFDSFLTGAEWLLAQTRTHGDLRLHLMISNCVGTTGFLPPENLAQSSFHWWLETQSFSHQQPEDVIHFLRRCRAEHLASQRDELRNALRRQLSLSFNLAG